MAISTDNGKVRQLDLDRYLFIAYDEFFVDVKHKEIKVMHQKKNKQEEKQVKRVIVKGYARPDATYYVAIPKDIRNIMDLKGGDFFIVKAKPEKREISLTIINFSDDQHK